VLVTGCGATSGHAPAPVPTPIGRGPEFAPQRIGNGPPPRSACLAGRRTGAIRVHLELFARRRAVVIPANVGVGRGCRFPLRTLTPTGVIELDRPGLTLGDFFRVWRMPLSRRRLLTFDGQITAFVGGTRWSGDPRTIPLTDGAQIVLEVGGYVRPHSFYLFPPR